MAMGASPKRGEDIARDATRLSRLASAAQTFEGYCRRWAEHNGQNSVALKSLSLYPPSTNRNGQWLVIGKAWDGGYKMVAFHRATNPLQALLGFFQRWAEGKLVWKHDQYGND